MKYIKLFEGEEWEWHTEEEYPFDKVKDSSIKLGDKVIVLPTLKKYGWPTMNKFIGYEFAIEDIDRYSVYLYDKYDNFDDVGDFFFPKDTVSKIINESNSWKDNDKYKFDILFIPSGELISVKYSHFQEFFKDTVDGEELCKFDKELDKWTIHDKHRIYFHNVMKQLEVDDILKDINHLSEDVDINWEDIDEEETYPDRKSIDLDDLGKGDILYAKDDFYMDSGKQFLIKNKGYKIDWIRHGFGELTITSEAGSDHYFNLDKSLSKYFYTV